MRRLLYPRTPVPPQRRGERGRGVVHALPCATKRHRGP